MKKSCRKSRGAAVGMAILFGLVAAGLPASAQASGGSSGAPADAAGLSAAEQAFLTGYLDHLNYMVFVADGEKLSPALAKMAVTQSNRYLIEKLGLSVIDFDQIEKNKKDQSAAWQSETGGSISMLQFLARKFNADVYVEIDFSVKDTSSGGKFKAAAQGTVKIFDPATATLLGSIPYTGQEAFSPANLDQAAGNAISSAVWALMPRITTQVKDLMRNSLAKGLRYELIINKTPDAKQMSTFRRGLAKKVREVEQASYTPEETRLNVFAFVKADKVQDLVFDAAEASGMPDLNLLYQRGRSLTFDSGLQ
ncbi:MAG: DUF6175 family protein [Spirochaetota bacterium]